MSQGIKIPLDFMNTGRIINLPDGVDPQDAATVAQLAGLGGITTETDPIFTASAAHGITGTDITNWNSAFSWGNHASAGYLTSITGVMVTTALGFTPYNATNPAGYITSSALSGYLLSATAASTYQPIGSYLTSITGTTNRISVSGSTIDISSAYVGQSSITTLGTIATGTWNATAIAAINGGTGFNTYATGDLIYASATNTLSKLAAGTNGYVLTLAGGVPTWAAASGGSGWSLTGNAGTTAGTNFIGTTDSVNFIIKANNLDRIRVDASTGYVGINRTTGLAINGVLNVERAANISAPHLILQTVYPSSTPTTISFQNNNFSGVGIGNGTISWNTAGTQFDINAGISIAGRIISSNWVVAGDGMRFTYGAGEYFLHTGAAGGYHIDVCTGNTQRLRFSNGGDIYINNRVSIGASSITFSAMLDLVSITKGFLPPRMTTSQLTAIASPAEALQAYDTTLHCYYLHNGTAWQFMLHAANATKTTAAAPYTNDGYVTVNIGGTNFKLMTTA